VDTHKQITLFIGEMGLKPFDRLDRFPRCLGKDKPRATFAFHFDDAGNLDLADLPLVQL